MNRRRGLVRRGLVARWGLFSILFIGIHSAAARSATQPTTEPATEPTTESTTQPATRPATPRSAVDIAVAGHTELAAAITALTKEYTQHLRDPQSTVRSSSSYFQDQPSPDVTEDSITAELRIKLAADARVDAYVKWQLLSGIASPIKDTIAGRLVVAYHTAAAPAILPGIDPYTRLAFERERTLIVRETDVPALDREIHDRQAAMNQANEPILAYCNELFAKLPPTYDALAVGLQDCSTRLNAGADLDSIESPLAEKISKWMDDPKATASQKTLLASAIERLADEKVSCITAVQWDEKRRQAKFEEKKLTLNTRNGNAKGQNKLTELVKDLRAAAENRSAH